MIAGQGLVARLRRRRDEWVIGAVLALLAFSLAAGSMSWRADHVLYDLGLTFWGRPPPDEVVIVAIDDASIDAIGRWPWPRAVHATMLHQLARASPRAVLLDLVLSESDPDPAQDQLLAEALRRAAPVVVPVPWQTLPGTAVRALEPVEPLRSAAGLGAAESAVDADGVLRSAFLHAGPHGHVYPHVALALLRAGAEDVHPAVLRVAEFTDGSGGGSGAGQRDGRFLIRYGGGPGRVQRVSYVDLLRGALPAQRLEGRYVLIGMTAQGLGDTLATPVNSTQMAMPGIEVLAHVLHTLRNGDTIHALPPQSAGLVSAALLGLLVTAFALSGTRAALALALVAIPLLVVASLLALASGWWWSPVPCCIAAALAYPLWSWRRLENAVDDLDREIHRLHAEGPAGSSTLPQARDRLASRVETLATATDTIRQARRFLAEALSGMPTAMMVVDDQGRVLLANTLAAQLFELEAPVDLEGLDLPGLLEEFVTPLPVDWRQVFSTAAAEPAPTGWAVEARLERLGDYVIHVAGIELAGRQRRIVTLADVAPLKQSQRRREELLAFVSHDLRSPATSIVLLADLHLQGRLDTPRDTLLAEVRRLAARTLQLSEDFVRTAQAESRPLALAEVSLRNLLDELLADHRPQAMSAGLTLSVPVPTPDLTWRLDQTLVSRAFGNLVSNAIKHGPAGTVVELALSIEADGLLFRVRDRGRGLLPLQLQQLSRGDQGLVAVDSDGVGFGLLFVQRVARSHGGVLNARPAEPGPGTEFELRLHRPP